MTIEEINAIGKVIRANRFHFKAPGVKALASHFEDLVPAFRPDAWFAAIEGRAWQPKTGNACTCRPGMERDNCPQCEGTGMRLDFVAIRNYPKGGAI